MQCYVLSRKILYRISSEWWRCNGVLPHRVSAAAFSTSQQRFTNETPPAAKKFSSESKAPEVNSAISHDTRTSDLPLVPMGERGEFNDVNVWLMDWLLDWVEFFYKEQNAFAGLRVELDAQDMAPDSFWSFSKTSGEGRFLDRDRYCRGWSYVYVWIILTNASHW